MFIILLIFISTNTYIKANNFANIEAVVNGSLNIKVYPEKRIPRVGNWQNENYIEIRNVGSLTPLFTQTVIMSSNSEGVINSLDPNIVPPGNYDLSIKGYSHLNKVFRINITNNAITYIDLNNPNQELLAGDTSVVVDNYINSLDLSQISINLYSGNLKNDLNRDTEVNSLDLSNMSFNLYKAGDL